MAISSGTYTFGSTSDTQAVKITYNSAYSTYITLDTELSEDTWNIGDVITCSVGDRYLSRKMGRYIWKIDNSYTSSFTGYSGTVKRAFTKWASIWDNLGNLGGNLTILCCAGTYNITTAPGSAVFNPGSYTLTVKPRKLSEYPTTTKASDGVILSFNYGSSSHGVYLRQGAYAGTIIFEGLNFVSTANVADLMYIYPSSSSCTTTYRFDRCVFKGSGTRTGTGIYYFWGTASSAVLDVKNCLFYNLQYPLNVWATIGTTSKYSNNTLYNNTYGFSVASQDCTFTNNLVQTYNNAQPCYANVKGALGRHNIASDTTADDFKTNDDNVNINSTTLNNLCSFVDSATYDLRLKSTDTTCKNTGYDLSASLDYDFFGRGRRKTQDSTVYYDKGACEYPEYKTFHVSTSGSDSNTHIQAQSSSTPWQTIGKINGLTNNEVIAGDTIKFKCGDTWDQLSTGNCNLIIPTAGIVRGASVDFFTVTSYGTGSYPKFTSMTKVLGSGVSSLYWHLSAEGTKEYYVTGVLWSDPGLDNQSMTPPFAYTSTKLLKYASKWEATAWTTRYSGAITSVVSSKLKDNTATFKYAGLFRVGQKVVKGSLIAGFWFVPSDYTYISSVESNTTLALEDHIFTSSTSDNCYLIYYRNEGIMASTDSCDFGDKEGLGYNTLYVKSSNGLTASPEYSDLWIAEFNNSTHTDNDHMISCKRPFVYISSLELEGGKQCGIRTESHGIRIKNLTVRNIGGTGVWLYPPTYNAITTPFYPCSVDSCYVYRAGYMGIMTSGDGYTSKISNCSVDGACYMGIYDGHSNYGTIVEHNLIKNCCWYPYNTAWGMNALESVRSEAGVTKTLFNQIPITPSILRYNFVKDTQLNPYSTDNDSHGIMLRSSYTEVYHNLLVNNASGGLIGWPMGGTDYASVENCKIFNNVFYKNCQSSTTANLAELRFWQSPDYDCGAHYIANNIFYRDPAKSTYFIYYSSKGATANLSMMDYNIYYQDTHIFSSTDVFYVQGAKDWNGIKALWLEINGSLDCNPNFVNPSPSADTDFKLAANSPCIDTGSALDSILTDFPFVDYFGNLIPR